MDLDNWTDIVTGAMASTRFFRHANAFYDGDLEDKGKQNKNTALRFILRLAQTPVEALLSWNEEASTSVNPNTWELFWYATYKKFGAVANTNRKLITQTEQ